MDTCVLLGNFSNQIKGVICMGRGPHSLRHAKDSPALQTVKESKMENGEK